MHSTTSFSFLVIAGVATSPLSGVTMKSVGKSRRTHCGVSSGAGILLDLLSFLSFAECRLDRLPFLRASELASSSLESLSSLFSPSSLSSSPGPIEVVAREASPLSTLLRSKDSGVLHRCRISMCESTTSRMASTRMPSGQWPTTKHFTCAASPHSKNEKMRWESLCVKTDSSLAGLLSPSRGCIAIRKAYLLDCGMLSKRS
mmetsp:Transcript_149260/g.260251  ORF Transcript_149260/g.260251 Transcript_149260/m.260251 type:complete len:202 (-) Transcript_149260:594-1199(-)